MSAAVKQQAKDRLAKKLAAIETQKKSAPNASLADQLAAKLPPLAIAPEPEPAAPPSPSPVPTQRPADAVDRKNAPPSPARKGRAKAPPKVRKPKPLTAAQRKAAKQRKDKEDRLRRKKAEEEKRLSVEMRKVARDVSQRKGTHLPLCLVAIKSAADEKNVEWHRKQYGVFIDQHAYSCIRVTADSKRVEYIPMTGNVIDVEHASLQRFESRWKPYIYPLNRAAEIYAEGAKVRGITELALKHLSDVLKRKLKLEAVSTEEAEERKGKPEVTVTTVSNGHKTETRESKAPKPSAPALISREDAAKAIKAGGRLRKGRDNDRRPGSAKAEVTSAIQKCTTVAAALKVTYRYKGIAQPVKFVEVRSAVRRGYVVIEGVDSPKVKARKAKGKK